MNETETEIFDPEIHAVDKDGNPSLNKDGTFRKKRSDAGRKKTAAAAGSTTARSTRKRAAAGGSGQRARYADGVAGLLQVPAAVLAIVDPVDGYCVAQHTPHIAGAVADLAVERPEVAAALERVLAVGPYGALIGAVLPLAVQIMHNHGLLPESMATAMGATPRTEIERHLKVAAGVEPGPAVRAHAAA